MNATKNDSVVLDAVSLLGFAVDPSSSEELVIRYGGWSLHDLHVRMMGQRYTLRTLDGNDRCPWYTERLPSGIYVLRVPVPASNKKNFREQMAMLPGNEEPAPVVLVATALLAHRLQTGEELLRDNFVRCREFTPDASDSVYIYWSFDVLTVLAGDDKQRRSSGWIASVRRS